MIDKNKAIIEYLLQCNSIKDSPLYFNFINARDEDKQIITLTNDVEMSRPFIDGSVMRQYLFTLLDFKSVSDNPLVTGVGYSNENVEEMADVQALIDWVKEQNDLHNYPDFGSDCIVEQIEPTSDNPKLEGVNTDVAPMLAMYSVTIRVRYLDNSKVLWR